MKYFDENRKFLFEIKAEADNNFWDGHWGLKENSNIVQKYENRNNKIIEVKITKKFLPIGSKILEGGCGSGFIVYALNKNKYKCIGLDYAEKTIDILKKAFPEMGFQLGDVRKLEYENNYFDGYWSLGVIEHFWEGYDKILTEMKRVIRNNGILFLKFPAISPLRRFKIFFGLYKKYESDSKPDNFYQFFLDHNIVADNFKKENFELLDKIKFNGMKGLKDEISLLKPCLQRLNDYKGKNILLRILRKSIDLMAKPFAYHSIILILKKNR